MLQHRLGIADHADVEFAWTAFKFERINSPITLLKGTRPLNGDWSLEASLGIGNINSGQGTDTILYSVGPTLGIVHVTLTMVDENDCVCCGYWDLRAYIVSECFPSMRQYTNLVRDYLGKSLYDGRWNEAVSWFTVGLDVAHDMCHLIASEGADEWASWWEWYFLPEQCSGGLNDLPLAQARFRSFASSA